MALLLGINVLWGSTYVVTRNALDTAPPLVLAFLRLALSAAFLLLWRSGRPPRETAPARTDPGAIYSLALVGLFGFGLSKLLHHEGLARSTATDAALIINLEPVFTAAFAAVLLRERLGPTQWLGVGVAFAGGLLLVWPSGEASHAGRALGNGLMVVSIAAEALASVLGVRAMRHYSGLAVTRSASSLGAAVLLAPALWQWHETGYRVDWLTPANGAALLYLSLGATVLAYVLWYRVLATVDAGRAGTYLYVQPLVGLALGILLRREWPTSAGWAGGTLVVLGILLASRATGPPKEAAR